MHLMLIAFNVFQLAAIGCCIFMIGRCYEEGKQLERDFPKDAPND